MKKSLIIGATMLDIVASVENLPNRGEDAYIKEQEMTLGGCAYNVADILKHLQVPHTLFSPIGTGMYASFIESKLREKGYEIAIKSPSMDNGYSMCLIEKDGERTFLTLAGIECYFKKEWFDSLKTKDYDKVYLSGYELEGEGGYDILDFLEENPHLEIFYAPGPRMNFISKDKHDRLFVLEPIIHLNEKEIEDFTGISDYKKASYTLSEITKNTIIVSLGDRGAYYLTKNEEMLIPTVPAKVVDTIGAGDSHIGAVMAYLSRGNSLRDSIKVANKISALVVSVKGSTLSKEEFEKGIK